MPIRSLLLALLFSMIVVGQPPKPLRERLLERAKQGDVEAQFDLGKNYETGRIGLPKDLVKAEYWYREAANRGEPFAQASLGILFGFGKGFPQDLVQAYMWYQLAGEHTTGGDQVSVVEMRDDLAKKLGAEQLAEAKGRARAWQEVMAAMDVYSKAMISRDGEALNRVLAADLAYVHSGGQFERKQDVIEGITKGKSPIERMDFSETSVRFYGPAVLVRGRVDLWHSATNIVHMNVLHVWVKGAQGWQMVSRQATKLAE